VSSHSQQGAANDGNPDETTANKAVGSASTGRRLSGSTTRGNASTGSDNERTRVPTPEPVSSPQRCSPGLCETHVGMPRDFC